MTVTYLGNGQAKGLSADTKPTTYPTNATFFETDTGRTYYWNGSAWVGSTVDEAALDVADLGGSLDVVKGGTGALTLTGVLKGNGTSAFTTLTGTFFGMWVGMFQGTSNTARFTPVGAGNQTGTTEADVSIIWPYAVTIKRIRYNISGNTKDGNTVMAFRDDGVDVQPNTQTAGSSTDFDSGALSTAVAANSVINFRHDTSASSSGTIQTLMYVIWEGALF